MKFLELLFDIDPIFSEELYLIVEFGEFIEYFVFILLIDLSEMNDGMSSMLNQ